MINLQADSARAGSARRIHPAHVRPLRARRLDSQHVPGRHQRGAVSHGRCDALVLPRDSSLLVASGDRGTSRQLVPAQVDLRCHRRHRGSASASIPLDGLLKQGRGIPADVDGCPGRRLGRDAAAREGGGNQRALAYNAMSLFAEWLREEGDPMAPQVDEAATRARESLQREVLAAEGGYLYDVIEGERGNDSACRPNRIFHLRSTIRSLANPPATVGLRRRPGASVARLACDRLRLVTATTRRNATAISGRAMRRITREPSGAWLVGAVCRRVLRVYRRLCRRVSASRGFEHHQAEGASARLARSSTPSSHTPRGCIAQAWALLASEARWSKDRR